MIAENSPQRKPSAHAQSHDHDHQPGKDHNSFLQNGDTGGYTNERAGDSHDTA